MECNYLSLPEIPASVIKVIKGPNVIGQGLIQVQMCSLMVSNLDVVIFRGMLEGYTEISGVHLQRIFSGPRRLSNQGLRGLLFTNIRWCKYVLSHWLNKMWCIYGLVQERHNSIANALELHLSCTNPSILGKQLNARSYKRIFFVRPEYICNMHGLTEADAFT